jgi:hypothetical protein
MSREVCDRGNRLGLHVASSEAGARRPRGSREGYERIFLGVVASWNVKCSDGPPRRRA